MCPNPNHKIKFPFARLYCWLLLLILAAAPNLHAQNNQPPSRFLFIVDTSAPMQTHGPEILKVVADILTSGASGQLRSGDTIGLWTFDQDVHSDLPLQVWSANEQFGITQRTTDFLKKKLTEKNNHANPPPTQRGAQPGKSPASEKPSRLETALPDLFTVIQASDTITVFIISTGDGQMSGTPFDSEINALYQQDVKDMSGRRMPIVTILQARAGKILHYTMNALPWPIVMPQPLILLSASAITPPAAAPKINPPVIPQTIIPPPTPVVQNTIPVTPAPTPVPELKPAPPAVVTAPPPTIAPPSAETLKPTTVTTVEEVKATPTIIHAEPAPKNPPPAIIEPTVVATPPPAPIKNLEPTPAPRRAPVVVEPPVKIEPAPPSASAALPAAKPILTSAPTNPPITPPAISPAPASVIQPQFATVPPEATPRPKILLVAGIILVLIACALIFLIIRRSRDTSGPSLITRSMGNRKK